jgi:hypothetical protein
VFGSVSLGGFVLAGDFAGFVYSAINTYHGETSSTHQLQVQDLLTNCGFAGDLAIQPGYLPGQGSFLTGLALSSEGFAAWEIQVSGSPTVETIYAYDAKGTLSLDSEMVPNGSSGLANLSIAGNQVSWTHDGQAMSAALGRQPC